MATANEDADDPTSRALAELHVEKVLRDIMLLDDHTLDYFLTTKAEARAMQEKEFAKPGTVSFNEWVDHVVSKPIHILTPREMAVHLIKRHKVKANDIKYGVVPLAREVFLQAVPQVLRQLSSVDNRAVANDGVFSTQLYHDRMAAAFKHQTLKEQKAKRSKKDQVEPQNFHCVNLPKFEEDAQTTAEVNRRAATATKAVGRIAELKSEVQPKTRRPVHGVTQRHWIYVGFAEGIGQFLDAFSSVFRFSLVLVYETNEKSIQVLKRRHPNAKLMGCIKRECLTQCAQIENEIKKAKGIFGPVNMCIAKSTPCQCNLLANMVQYFGRGNGFIGSTSNLVVWVVAIFQRTICLLTEEDFYCVSWEMAHMKPEPREFRSHFTGTWAYCFSSLQGNPSVGHANRKRDLGTNICIDGQAIESEKVALPDLLPDGWVLSPHFNAKEGVDSFLKTFEGSLASVHGWRTSQWAISSKPDAWQRIQEAIAVHSFTVDALNVEFSQSFENDLLRDFRNMYEVTPEWHKLLVPLSGLIEFRERCVGLEGGVTRGVDAVTTFKGGEQTLAWMSHPDPESAKFRFDCLGESIDLHLLKGFCRAIKTAMFNGTQRALVPCAGEAMLVFDKSVGISPASAFKETWMDRSKREAWLASIHWPKLHLEPPFTSCPLCQKCFRTISMECSFPYRGGCSVSCSTCGSVTQFTFRHVCVAYDKIRTVILSQQCTLPC